MFQILRFPSLSGTTAEGVFSRSLVTKGNRHFILSEDECLCQGIVNKALKKKGCGLHYHPPAFFFCPEMCSLLNHVEKNNKIYQKSPFTFPVSTSTSTRRYAGSEHVPGISLIFPAMGTTNPAPLNVRISRILSLQFFGAPFILGLSVSERCVFTMHVPSFEVSGSASMAFTFAKASGL